MIMNTRCGWKQRTLIHVRSFAHYRPQRSWGKVVFSQASVILLTGGACVVAPGGGMHGFFRGGTVCVVFTGGGSVHGFCQGGVHGFFLGGHAWFFWGGVRRIRRDMVNERAVRILLECILVTVVNLPQFS